MRQHARGRLIDCQSFASCALVGVAPGQQDRTTVPSETRQQISPAFFGPQLVGAARRMDEYDAGMLGRNGRFACDRRLQTKARRSVERVTERRCGELPAAIDKM